MNRKTSVTICIFVAVVAITACNSQAIAKQAASPEQLERQRIENYYAQRFENLQQLAEDRAKKLEYSYRLLWTRFLKTTVPIQTPSVERYILTPSFLKHKTYKLRGAMMDSYSVYATRTWLLDRDVQELLTHIEASQNYTHLMRTESRKILNVMDELLRALSRLQGQREADLARLEKPEKTHPKMLGRNIVNAIALGEKRSFAMIDDKIVYEADRIKGIKILKIHRDKIEFEKNAKTWTQKLGEKKEAFWQ